MFSKEVGCSIECLVWFCVVLCVVGVCFGNWYVVVLCKEFYCCCEVVVGEFLMEFDGVVVCVVVEVVVEFLVGVDGE